MRSGCSVGAAAIEIRTGLDDAMALVADPPAGLADGAAIVARR